MNIRPGPSAGWFGQNTTSNSNSSTLSGNETEFFPPNVSITPETSSRINGNILGKPLNTASTAELHRFCSYNEFLQRACNRSLNLKNTNVTAQKIDEKQNSTLWKLLNECKSTDELAAACVAGNKPLACLKAEDVDLFERDKTNGTVFGPLPTDNLLIDLSSEARYFTNFGNQGPF